MKCKLHVYVILLKAIHGFILISLVLVAISSSYLLFIIALGLQEVENNVVNHIKGDIIGLKRHNQ